MRAYEDEELFSKIHQIFSVSIFHHWLSQFFEIIFPNPTHSIGNFFDTTHLETLTLLDDRYKIRSIKHTLMGTCIEPSISSIHNFDLELSSEKEFGIHCCNLELTSITWDDIFGYLDHIIRIEIQSYHCKM